MKIGLLTFEQFQGKKDIGSSRIRGHWIVKNWKNAGEDLGEIELFKHGGSYDVVIFQKAYFVEFAKRFKGLKILDLCDPDWLDWSYKFKEMIEEVDIITCSSEALALSVGNFTDKPVYFIPDRIDFSLLPEPKIHEGDTKSIVWYGYSNNFSMLDSAVAALSKLGVKLIVISNGVYALPASIKMEIQNLPFSSAFYMQDIQKGDVCINPQHTKGKWKYKSDNKTTLAQALGVPVAKNMDELNLLMTAEQRNAQVAKDLKDVKENYDVLQSVKDIKLLIKTHAKTA